MIEWKLQGHFVCDRCRQECGACISELERVAKGEEIEDKNLYPRKQLIGCLGPYCDKPCFRQKKTTDLTLDHMTMLARWMGNKLNKNI
jgi:hypothetical protein